MKQSNQKGKNLQATPPALPPNLVQDFINVQAAEAQNQAQELQIRNKEIDRQYDHAKEVLKVEGELLKNKPKEHRLTILTYSGIVVVIILLFAGVIYVLINIGQKEMAENLINWTGRVVVIAISFLLGRLSGLKKWKKQSNPAEVID